MVIDTGIFIEFLRKKNKKNTSLYELAINQEVLYISTVTLYELLMGATTPIKKQDIELLTKDLITLPFDEEVAKKAASIYYDLKIKNQLIEFRDIFIGATCLVANLPLKTFNKKHFDRIEGLKY